MAVIIAVGPAEGKFFVFPKEKDRIHIIGKITDIQRCRNELYGDIIADAVNGDGGIFTDFAGMVPGSLITVQRYAVNTAVEGSSIGPHVIHKQ